MDELIYASGVRSVLALALVAACGFSVPANRDGAIDTPDAPPDVPVVTWAIDPTSGKAVPANATEWRDFLKAKGLNNIMAPNGLWLAQESGGALADSVGTVALAPFNGPTYAAAVPGWTRHAVGTPDGTFSGFANTSDPNLPNVGATSMTVLLLMQLPSGPPPGTRTFLVEGSSSPLSYIRADIDATKHYLIGFVGPPSTTTTGTQDPGAVPAGVMMKLDITNAQQKLITRTETITLGNSPLGASRGLQLGGTVWSAPVTRYLYVVAWYGARAEISDVDARALLTALNW